MIRIVVTGSESTGKTTLVAQLAKYFAAALVPEFVRDFVARKGGVIDFGDHGPIAKGQMALEDQAKAANPRLIVQDTDLLSTVVYCEHYFGHCPPWIREEAAKRAPDLYLLCDIDLPWVADGVRDRGHMREEMHRAFRDAVLASGVPVATISGAGNERLERATEAVDALLIARE